MRSMTAILALVASAGVAQATQYPLASPDALMFGDVESITAHAEDTLPDLARRSSLGYEEIQRANPGVDLWLPGEGTPILIPNQRLLPQSAREGIVVRYPHFELEGHHVWGATAMILGEFGALFAPDFAPPARL